MQNKIYSEDYKVLSDIIKKAKVLKDLDRIENTLEIILYYGVITPNEFRRLDAMIVIRKIKIGVRQDGENNRFQ